MRRLLNLFGFRRGRMQHDLDRELRFHLDRRVETLVAAGMSEPEARKRAAIELGGFAHVQGEVRWLDGLLRDIQYAFRTLLRSPGFTCVALLSLALGIGANAAIFGVFYAVLVRPLPYQDPDRLVSLAIVSLESPGGFVLTPEFVAWRASSRAFESLTAWNDEQFNLTGTGTPERIVGASVTAGFLHVLGVQPVLGRSFSIEDDEPASEMTALLTHKLWRRQFGADPSVIGRPILLNDQPCTLIGVLPAGFGFPGDLDPEILVPSRLLPQPDWGAPSMGMLRAVGRLREGITPDSAAEELSSILASHEPDMPAWIKGQRKESTMQVVALQQQLVGDTRPAFLVLLAAVGLLLLIACVNVASLQVGRAAVRRREIGLRAALGASRARLVRSLVVENLMLAVLAGIAGLVVAVGFLQGLRMFPGLPIRDPNDLRITGLLGGTALLLATVCGLAIGLVPALASPRVDLNEVLKTGSRSLVSGSGTRVRSILVAAQVAFAVILLLGSGLFLRSLHNVLTVDLGFDAERVITARLNLPGSRYDTESKRAAFGRALVEQVGALPSVSDVATTNSLPLTGYTLGTTVLVEGQPEPPPGERFGAPVLVVSPGYLRALRIRLLSGRTFDERDSENSQRVVIASRSFATRFFSTTDVVGKRVRFGSSPDWTTIIGVAEDILHSGREKDAEPELLIPSSQMPPNRLDVIVRGNADPSRLAASLQSVVWSLDKDLPVYDIVTMEERLWRSGEARTARTLLLSSFALLAICLAAVGIYGVVSQAVQQRMGEIGLRMALGAEGRDVRRMVMRRSLMLAMVGAFAGSVAAFWLLRNIAPLLYRVEPTDAGTFAGVGFLLIAVALLAGYLPARRASKIDPLAALRCE